MAEAPAPGRPEREQEPSAQTPLRLKEITTLQGLLDLAAVWDEVLEGSESCTPFLSHEWVLSWWESFGRDHQLWILVLEDEQGVCAIAPFGRFRRNSGPLRYRSVELIGTGPLRFLGMGGMLLWAWLANR